MRGLMRPANNETRRQEKTKKATNNNYCQRSMFFFQKKKVLKLYLWFYLFPFFLFPVKTGLVFAEMEPYLYYSEA